jgi:predicted  nucleic acid-binding Zn-ribbon protein/glycosyltransferase involved in cell wall biosynthesis
MRVLVVFHGWLPEPRRPGSGGAIRAWHHIEALREAGHRVHTLTRAQDSEDGFRSARHLRSLARTIAPDAIVCVQPEEAAALAGLGVPMVVDLYAPRLLEAPFEGSERVAEEAVNTLRAIASGDAFLFSNPRQRHFGLGLLALAGVDLLDDPSLIVPLAACPAPPPRRAPRHPVLVMGGVAWPWQDPTEALARTQAHLEARRKGRLLVLGGKPAVGETAVVDLPSRVPPGKRLSYQGPLPYPDLLEAYASSSAMLDVMAPNAERELALSFRHLDALSCGLPLITTADNAIAAQVLEFHAGWVVDGDLEGVLDQVLDAPEELARRSQGALELARHYSRDRVEAPLVAWMQRPTLRRRGGTPLAEAAELTANLAEARAQAEAARDLCARAQAETQDKREENRRLSDQIAALTGTVERLTRSLDEVAGFKREAVRVLGSERDAVGEEARSLARELSDLRADLAKKDAEQRASRREIDRLNQAIAGLQDEASYGEERLLEAGQREARLRGQRDSMKARAEGGVLARILRRLRGD